MYEKGNNYAGFCTSVNLVGGTFNDDGRVNEGNTLRQVRTLGDERALILHSLGLCKFATAPPMQEFYVNALGFRLCVKNFDGVTVWDVLERLDHLYVPSRQIYPV